MAGFSVFERSEFRKTNERN